MSRDDWAPKLMLLDIWIRCPDVQSGRPAARWATRAVQWSRSAEPLSLRLTSGPEQKQPEDSPRGTTCPLRPEADPHIQTPENPPESYRGTTGWKHFCATSIESPKETSIPD